MEKVKKATQYMLSYRNASAKKWTEKIVKNKKITLKGMKKGKFYQFRVASIKTSKNKITTSNYSKISYRYIKNSKISKVTTKNNAITVKWKKASKASGYQVLYSTDELFNTAQKITVGGANKTSYTIKNLKKGQRYYIRVRLIKKKGGKTYIGVLSKPKKIIVE